MRSQFTHSRISFANRCANSVYAFSCTLVPSICPKNLWIHSIFSVHEDVVCLLWKDKHLQFGIVLLKLIWKKIEWKWNQEITFASRTSLVVWLFASNSPAVDLPMFVAATTEKIASNDKKTVYVVCDWFDWLFNYIY